MTREQVVELYETAIKNNERVAQLAIELFGKAGVPREKIEAANARLKQATKDLLKQRWPSFSNSMQIQLAPIQVPYAIQEDLVSIVEAWKLMESVRELAYPQSYSKVTKERRSAVAAHIEKLQAKLTEWKP